MNDEKVKKSELELEIDKKIVKSINDVKTKKQLLAEAENRKKQLEQDAKEIGKKIRRLKLEADKADAYAKRDADTRLKIHAGGMVEMTGLLRYVYPEGVATDNPQDRLIANLLVGALMAVSEVLEKSSTIELQRIWEKGRDFRKLSKDARSLPDVNKNINPLFESLDLIKTTIKQQPNYNVQDEQFVDEVESQENDN